MPRMLLVTVVTVPGTGCGAATDDPTGLPAEELGTTASELAALEHNAASGPVSWSLGIINWTSGARRDGSRHSRGAPARCGSRWRNWKLTPGGGCT